MIDQTVITTNGATAWKSERLIYRAVEDDDEVFFRSFYNDSESILNATTGPAVPRGKKDATSLRKSLQEDCILGVIVCLLPSPSEVQIQDNIDSTNPINSSKTSEAQPVPIGHVALVPTFKPERMHHRRAMVGINLLRHFHGRGYGSEAIQWCLRWGFRFGNLHSIEIGAVEYNPRAVRLYERLGFKPEGRKREAVWFDGRYWDVIELGMLDREWKERYGGQEGEQAKALAEREDAI